MQAISVAVCHHRRRFADRRRQPGILSHLRPRSRRPYDDGRAADAWFAARRARPVFRNQLSLEFKIRLPLPEVGDRTLLVQASPLLVGAGELSLAAVLVTDLTMHQMDEGHYRGLIEFMPDAMVIVDGQGNIVLVNAQTQSLFGYAEQEMIGKHIDILIPERFRQAHRHHHREYFADPRVRPMGIGMELFGLRKNGENSRSRSVSVHSTQRMASSFRAPSATSANAGRWTSCAPHWIRSGS
ncbi:MAG: PAS domain S-box protein [Anaerolineae bacterium]